jgi:hypothetical protein
MLIGVIAEESLLSLSLTISADIAEVVVATDATATGNIVFATLVDDPASVGEIVDAYLGEIMLEAASAADTVEAGLSFVAAIVEDLTALAAEDGAVPAVYTDAITETVTAADVIDASTVLGTPKTTIGAAGPLLVFDTTFAASSLTVINAGR